MEMPIITSSKIDRCEAITDIIESVALQQATLSHILNAEGEQLQKIVCLSDDSCQILKANASVEKTIVSITQLEQVLYAKLKLATELCEKHNQPCE